MYVNIYSHEENVNLICIQPNKYTCSTLTRKPMFMYNIDSYHFLLCNGASKKLTIIIIHSNIFNMNTFI